MLPLGESNIHFAIPFPPLNDITPAICLQRSKITVADGLVVMVVRSAQGLLQPQEGGRTNGHMAHGTGRQHL